MLRESSLSITDALGRAPPSEDPGASRNWMSCALARSSSIFWAVDNSSGSLTNGGIGFCALVARNWSGLSAREKRSAPIRAVSLTPSRRSIPLRATGRLFSALARCTSARCISIRPQRSGAESLKGPNSGAVGSAWVAPSAKASNGPRANRSGCSSQALLYSNEARGRLLFRLRNHRVPTGMVSSPSCIDTMASSVMLLIFKSPHHTSFAQADGRAEASLIRVG